MGLDMYIKRRRYITSDEFSEAEYDEYVKAFGTTFNSITLSTTVGQWRNAYAINRWFGDRFGLENGQEVAIQREDLEELLDLCETVLGDKYKASELLPTEEDFEDYGVSYNEQYFSDLATTVEQLEEILDNWEETDEYFYYGSW